MRKFVLVCCVPFLLTLCTFAQHMEVSGAYDHLTPGKDGFNFSAAFLAAKHFGLEGDVGGFYPSKDSVHVYTVLGGPKVMFATHDALFTPYVHLLVGEAREFSNNYLGVLPGGGVDVGTKRIALRLKFDAIHFNDGTHALAGAGIVLRW